MKILVFGKTGQVAKELQRQHDVLALSRQDADLTDAAACADVIAKADADVIINAAAYTDVDGAENEPDIVELVNATAPIAMAQAAAARGLPFLHLSTEYVFDGSGEQPWAVNDQTGPLSVYGRSKLMGEQGIAQSGGVFAIVRTSWVFSAFNKNFVKSIVRLGHAKDEINVINDQIGGPTSAADIASVLIKLAQRFYSGDATNSIYHFAGQPDISRADFARQIIGFMGQKTKVTDVLTADFSSPATRPLNSRLQCDAIEFDHGIVRPDWRKGLKEVLQELGEYNG